MSSHLQKLIFRHAMVSQLMQNPNFLGELLLEYSFVGEGRGCYSNFELRQTFEPCSWGVEQVKDDLLGFGYAEEDGEDEDVAKIKCFYDSKIDLMVAWFWSGDGHLIFKFDGTTLENTDIKKDYTWKFL